MRAFLICMLGLFCVSHLFAKWFADFPAVLCFAIAMPRHWRGDIRRLLAARFRVDERERILYTHFPPTNIADMRRTARSHDEGDPTWALISAG